MAKSVKTCSFCGRPESQVEFFIMGQGGEQICNECAVQAAEIVKENLTQKSGSQSLNRPYQFAQYGMIGMGDDVIENYVKDMLKKEDTVKGIVERVAENKITR